MAKDGLVLVGTLGANGWPRISPVEPLIMGEQLYLGMTWASRQAVDLLAAHLCVVHTAVSDDRNPGRREDLRLGYDFAVVDGGHDVRTWRPPTSHLWN